MGPDPVKRLPCDGYEILLVVGSEPLDPVRDNVDVLVNFENGATYAAVFTTLGGIRERMRYYQESGECANGLYFWTSDLIIVEELTEDIVRRTVADLVKTNTLDLAFDGPSYDINPAEDD